MAIAQEVAIQRGALMTEVFLHMAAIRSLVGPSRPAGDAEIQCVAAHVQDMRAQSGQQAAHLLPGQILIGGRPVWELVPAHASSLSVYESIRLEQQTKLCFAKTNVLPAIFNRADSQAEVMARRASVQGLKELFGAAVLEMWSSARVDVARPLVIDREAALRGLQMWFEQVTPVYEEAAQRKHDAWLAAQTQRSAENRALESRILSIYADSFKVVSVARFAQARVPEVFARYESL
ncbi:Hypothetical protein A7982_11908 [Minicystis rosea]|nr:Hypothetical protein A7982_11908 [Minicystis rosea]